MAVGGMLVGAVLHLFLISSHLGEGLEVFLFFYSLWPDDGEWHLPHFEKGRHGTELSLVEQTHQRGLEDVVLMVAEGDFVAT